MNQKIGVLGYGEVGQAIAKFYKNSRIKDLNRDDGFEGVEVLNVCIPWSKHFIKIVSGEIKKIKPKLVIVHSTVPVGTTKKLALGLPKGLDAAIAHSPIRGVHPNLYGGIKTFVKYVGSDSRKAGVMAQKHMESLGMKTKLFEKSAESEALKLWDTTQYGWMILLNKGIKEWCDKKGLDFDAVYTDANKSYVEGYKKLGRPEVARPYLKYMPGKIGGHCVIPNCQILDSEIAKIILKKNKKL